MLFRKDIEPRCGYCAFSKSLSEKEIACKKKGVMQPQDSCRAFEYDPLKRTPPKPAQLVIKGLKDEDFSL